jgi:hypothetical protein
MCYDTHKRLTAMRALAHPWLGAFAIATPVHQRATPPLPPSSLSYSTPKSHQKHHQQQFSSSESSSSTPSSGQSHVKGKGTRSNSNEVLDMVLYPHYNANIQGNA